MLGTRHGLAPTVAMEQAVNCAVIDLVPYLRFTGLPDLGCRSDLATLSPREKRSQKVAFFLPRQILVAATSLARRFHSTRTQAVVGGNRVMDRRRGNATLPGDLFGFPGFHQGIIDDEPALSAKGARIGLHPLLDFFSRQMSGCAGHAGHMTSFCCEFTSFYFIIECGFVLLMHWEAGYEHPWAVLTDLSPEQAEVSWYGMRTWIESGFKDFKRGLWGWHHSKMVDASRVERLWLAMAVAQVWTVSIGCQAEEKERQVASGESLPAQHIARRKRKRPADQPPPRQLSCVVRGRLGLVAALFTAEVLPCGTLLAEAWPETISAPRKLPKPSHLRERERKREQKRRARARQRVAA
jgi:hypothetical protein